MKIAQKVAQTTLLLTLSLTATARDFKLDQSCLDKVKQVPVVTAEELGSKDLIYPLVTLPEGIKDFGTPLMNRYYTNARGGVDLIAKENMPVRSMTNGIVKSVSHWFMGTKSISVETPSGALVRYGFLKNVKVRHGDEVKAGDFMAAIGNANTLGSTRLRVEIFENSNLGGLSKSQPCINRRSDVLNPSSLLEDLEQELLENSTEI